jgi:hypothetical protein
MRSGELISVHSTAKEIAKIGEVPIKIAKTTTAKVAIASTETTVTKTAVIAATRRKSPRPAESRTKAAAGHLSRGWSGRRGRFQQRRLTGFWDIELGVFRYQRAQPSPDCEG